MINLNNTEFILFDFDDTLCIHTEHKWAPEDEYNKNVLLGIEHWDDCKPNRHMKEFMQLCQNKGKKKRV